VFLFDGKTTAVEVPLDEADADMGGRFTLMTWMKHAGNEHDGNPHGTKEHIVCSSDGDGKFFWYINNSNINNNARPLYCAQKCKTNS